MTTYTNIDTFRRQLKMLGFSYDWDRELATTGERTLFLLFSLLAVIVWGISTCYSAAVYTPLLMGLFQLYIPRPQPTFRYIGVSFNGHVRYLLDGA